MRFLLCGLATIAVHTIILLTLYKWPLILAPTPLAMLLRTYSHQKQEAADAVLIQEALEEIAVLPMGRELPLDLAMLEEVKRSDPLLEERSKLPEVFPPELAAAMPAASCQDPPLDLARPKEPLATLPPTLLALAPLPSGLDWNIPKADLEPIAGSAGPQDVEQSSATAIAELEEISPKDLLPLLDELPPLPSLATPSLPTASLEAPLTTTHLLLGATLPDAPPIAPRPQQIAPFDTYLSEELALALTESESFDVRIRLTPAPSGGGYFFVLHLEPHADLKALKMPQCFTFVLDRSNSVGKYRYASFKKGIQRALALLEPDDRFNIYILDRKVAQLSSEPLPISPETIHRSERFLEDHPYQGAFAAGDIYALLPQAFRPLEGGNTLGVNTFILLSDGNTLLKRGEQKEAIRKWLQKEGGHVSLYTAAAGTDNNLALLDLLATVSKGSLLYSETHAAFPRKFAELIQSLKYPIAHAVSLTGITSEADAKISFYPSPAPNLYATKPYLLLGTLSKATDFTLVLQGTNRDERVMVRKAVPFTIGNTPLDKEWAKQQAYVSYAELLK